MDPLDSDCESPWVWGFSPGDRVHIRADTFVGAVGEVLNYEQAMRRLREAGQMWLRPVREDVWVLMEVYGRPTPVQFSPEQIGRA
jgi:hypothetical protein